MTKGTEEFERMKINFIRVYKENNLNQQRGNNNSLTLKWREGQTSSKCPSVDILFIKKKRRTRSDAKLTWSTGEPRNQGTSYAGG